MQTNPTPEIKALWKELRTIIDASYRHGLGSELRDYTTSGWNDDLAKLLDAETANERQHRRGCPVEGWRAPISAPVAAQLILMHNIVDGAARPALIPATFFLELRKTACEAMVIGWLCRALITPEFRARVESLDYADVMKAGN